jgi:hypothetical protein
MKSNPAMRWESKMEGDETKQAVEQLKKKRGMS